MLWLRIRQNILSLLKSLSRIIFGWGADVLVKKPFRNVSTLTKRKKKRDRTKEQLLQYLHPTPVEVVIAAAPVVVIAEPTKAEVRVAERKAVPQSKKKGKDKAYQKQLAQEDEELAILLLIL